LPPETARSVAGVTLKVIPVIDVLNGVAVHAVRGRREQYRPIRSTLCGTANPFDEASAFRSLGFREMYVADLDAILGGRPSLLLCKQLARGTGLLMMVDAGVTNLTDAGALLATGIASVVIGTETLTDPHFVRQAVHLFGTERLFMSLDMRNGRLLTRSADLEGLDPASAASLFQSMGATRFIALDLARVGSLDGIDTHVLEALIGIIRGEIIVGGGIRDLRDLKELRSLGVHGALVATSLHSGVITIRQLKDEKFIA